MWQFLAVGNIGFRHWKWVHHSGTGRPARSRRSDFPGFSEAMADAGCHGFEPSVDRWEIITGTGTSSSRRPGTPRRSI